jgi:serine/threonine protein kinase
MAPEILEEKNYGMEADVYSLGVIFYQLLFGDYPFNAGSEF